MCQELKNSSISLESPVSDGSWKMSSISLTFCEKASLAPRVAFSRRTWRSRNSSRSRLIPLICVPDPSDASRTGVLKPGVGMGEAGEVFTRWREKPSTLALETL
ncbi:hypothetical protein D3C86_1760450 [compost metagenome]